MRQEINLSQKRKDFLKKSISSRANVDLLWLELLFQKLTKEQGLLVSATKLQANCNNVELNSRVFARLPCGMKKS
jgi:hypothetical protein